MVAWSQLLLPALLATGLVFVASSLVHMVLQWHRPDYRRLPDEEAVRQALRASDPPPGQYMLPHCGDMKAAAGEEMQRKYREGPNGLLYLRPKGPPSMGKALGLWTLYCFVVALLAGYVGKAALPSGAAFAAVLHVVGTAAFLGFAGQAASDSIWKGKPWIITFRSTVDGLAYALLTALAFAWLWPR